jgi:hypothetical protein
MVAPMRALATALVFVACTRENPAFLVDSSEAGTSAPTTANATAATASESAATSAQPTTGASTDATATTSATSASSEPGTTAPPETTAVDTTGGVGQTTGEPPDTTTTGGSDGSTGGSTGDSTGGDPMMCQLVADLGPIAKLLDRDTNEHIKIATCAPWSGVTYVGKLKSDPMGFVVEQDMVCGNNKVPANLRITVPIPPTIKALNACVSLRFGVHANYPECHLASLRIDQGGAIALEGRFGTTEPPALTGLTVEPHLLPGCLCPDCCGAEMPDPGPYDLIVDGAPVSEGMTAPNLQIAAKKYTFSNLRSHIHTQCDDPQYLQADWLHFDWVIARTF